MYGKFTKDEKEKSQYALEKCCTTTQSIQPLHSQARRPLGHFHSWNNFPFRFSGVDDCCMGNISFGSY